MAYPIYALFRLFCGTLYPGFQSYKAVRTKNVREYVKWMMYWIVYAVFTGIESFTDIFLSFWFPFYYEIKVLFFMWLLSPVSKGSLGSSIIYRKFIHPVLLKREQEIDKYLDKIGNQGYHTFRKFANQGFNFLTNMLMQTAIKGGGGLITHLKRSYSLSDLSAIEDSGDDVREKPKTTLSQDHKRPHSHEMTDDEVSFRRPGLIKRSQPVYSSGDLSSGYSSTAEFLPVVGEVMDTEDYELYNPRIHRRYQPVSRTGSVVSSIGNSPPTQQRRKKEYNSSWYPLNAPACLPSEGFSKYNRSSWIADDSDSCFTGGTVTPSYNIDEEDVDDTWSDSIEEFPNRITEMTSDDDEDKTPNATRNECNSMSTDELLRSASLKISQEQLAMNSPKRYKAPDPPPLKIASLNTDIPPSKVASPSIDIPSSTVASPNIDIPVKIEPNSSTTTLSPTSNSKCPHCTIHAWLPHYPGCPNLKPKGTEKKK